MSVRHVPLPSGRVISIFPDDDDPDLVWLWGPDIPIPEIYWLCAPFFPLGYPVRRNELETVLAALVELQQPGQIVH